MIWSALRRMLWDASVGREQIYVVLATHGGEGLAFSVHAVDETDALAKLAKKTAGLDIVGCRPVPPPARWSPPA
jgi:hypothetical protein